MANQINFELRTSADLKGVKELKKELQEVRNLAQSAYSGEGPLVGDPKQIQETVKAANLLETALNAAYNPKVNMLDIQKFNKFIQDSGTDAKQLYKNLAQVGPAGERAFLSAMRASSKLGESVQKTNKFVDKMATTFKNTVSWGISSAVWNEMISGAEQAYGYVKSLDGSLNDIRIVTGKSAEEMKKFAESANEAAKSLAVETTDYTKGSTIYYQQGLDDETVETLTNVTAKASNVTGQGMDEVSEQLTAVWNGYQVANQAAEEGMGVYEEYVDKMAAVGAATASDLEELATAMSKVASSANLMGIDFDQLNAQIATIVSVTRQAPESVGTALKTIYARLGDLKMGGTDEDGVNLGEVSNQLNEVGIQVLDSSGNMREMGVVMEEVAAKWDTWTEAQRQAMAVAMAGKRQYNNLLALFENWDMYSDTLSVAQNATGTLQEQQDIYLESTNAKLEQLSASTEDLFDSLLDTESINNIIDGLITVVDLTADLADSLGGLNNILPLIASLSVKAFGPAIGESLSTIVQNTQNQNKQLEIQKRNLEERKQSFAAIKSAQEEAGMDVNPEIEKQLKEVEASSQKVSELNGKITEEQLKQVDAINDQRFIVAENASLLDEEEKKMREKAEFYGYYKDSEESLYRSYKERLQEANQELTINEKLLMLNKQSGELEKEKANVKQERAAILGAQDIPVPPLKQEDYGEVSQKGIEAANKALIEMKNNISDASKIYNKFDETLKKTDFGKTGVTDLRNKLKEYRNELKKSNKEGEYFVNQLNELREGTEISEKQIEKIIKKFKELKDSGMTAEEAIEQLLKGNEEYGKSLDNLSNKIGTSIDGLKKLESQGGEEINDKLDLDFAFQNVTNLTSSLGGLWTAWNMVSELGSIWDNDDLTTGEKLEQTFMNLAFVIPTLVESLKTLHSVNLKKTKGTIADTLATSLNTAAEKLNANAKRDNTKATEKNAIAQGAETASDAADTKGNVVNSASEQAESWKKLGDAVDNYATKSFENLKIKLQGVVKVVAALPLPIKIAIGLGAVAGAISMIGNAIQSIKLKEEVAETTTAAEEATKLTAQLKEQADVVNNLSNSYQELISQLKDGSLSLEDFRNKAYQLFETNGKHDLAVKSLTASYSELMDMMSGVDTSAQSELANAAEKEANAYRNKAEARLKQAVHKDGSTKLDNGGKTIDLQGMGSTILGEAYGFLGNDVFRNLNRLDFTEERGNFEKDLENLGVSVDATGQISIEQFIKAATQNRDELEKVLNSSNTKAAEQLRDYLNEISEDLDAYAQAISQEQEASLNSLIDNNSISNSVKSLDDYTKKFNELKEQAKSIYIEGGMSEEEASEAAEKWVRTQLSAIDSVVQYAQQSDIQNALFEKQKTSDNPLYDELLEEIKHINDQDLLIRILTDIDTLPASESVDAFIDKEEQKVVELKVVTKNEEVKQIIDNGQPSDQEISTLYQDDIFQQQSGYSEDQFRSMDTSAQLSILTEYYTEAARIQELGVQETIENTRKEIEAYNNRNQTLANLTDEERAERERRSNLFENAALASTENDSEVPAYIEQIKEQLSPDGSNWNEIKDNADASIKSMMEGMEKIAKDNGLNISDYIKWEQESDELKEYDSTIDALEKTIKDTEKQNVDWADTQEKIQKAVSATQSGIDNIQSSYSTLTGVINQYNQAGYLTMDNLQSILTMQPEYLAALEWENGQMSLNQDTMIALTEAKLDEAEAEAIVEAMAELNAIATREVTTSAYQAQVASYELAKAYGNEANLADVAAAANKELAAARAAANAKDSGATAQVMDNLDTKLKAIENVRANLGTNFSGVMGGGAGSGAGSSSAKEKEVVELNKDKVDVYKQLKQSIQSCDNALSKLQEREEHLSGKALIKNLEKQAAAYERQTRAIQKLNKAAAVQVATLKDQGSKYSKIKYDKDGNITQKSYEKEFAKQQKAYNKAIKKYNNSAQTEADKTALDAAEKAWDQFNQWVDDYDEAVSKMEDSLNQLQEALQNVADVNLKKFDVTFDVKLDTEELNRSWLEFQQKYQKDFRKLAKITAKDIRDLTKMAKSFQDSFGVEQDRFSGIQSQAEKMAEIYGKYVDANGAVKSDDVDDLVKALKKEGIQYTSITDLQKDLQESFVELQDYADSLFETLQQGWQNYLQSIDDIMVNMDELMGTYDRLAKKNEYYLRIAELTSGVYDKTISKTEQLKKVQEQYYETTINNSKSQLEALNSSMNVYQEMLDTMTREYRAQGKSDEEIALMEDYDKVKKKLDSLKDSYQDIAIGAIEAGDALKEMAKQEAFDKLEKSLAGTYGSLEKMNRAWEDAMEYQDRYYDSTQRLYELDSLESKYDDAIKSSKLSLENQQKLNTLKEKELKYLKDKDKLTKDDIALANQRYNIAMAEMALEEAMNNKNSMKVTRNAEGNWSYQYVADEENVQDKEQALKDEYHELYEMAKEAYQSSLELAMQTKEEYLERFKEIIEDEEIAEVDKKALIEQLNQEYSERLKGYYDEAAAYMVDVNSSSAEIVYGYYEGNLEKYNELSEKEKAVVNSVKEAKVTSYDEVRDAYLSNNSELMDSTTALSQTSIAGWQDTNNEIQNVIDSIEVESLDCVNIVMDAQEEYRQTCDDVSRIVGEDWSDMGQYIADTEQDAETAQEAVVTYGEEAVSQIDDEIDALSELENMWESVQSAIEKCKDALDDMLQSAQQGIQSVTQAAQQAANAANNAASSAGGGSYSGGGSGGYSSGGTTQKTHSITVNRVGPDSYVVYDNTIKKRITSESGQSSSWVKKKYGKFQIGTYDVTKGFKTGGYTGQWSNGSDEVNGGKLAFLHQKELVLNEKDTANFLEAINVIRDVTSLTSSVTDSIMNGIAKMVYGMMEASKDSSRYNNVDTARESIQTSPVYNINADFPNATDKQSIIEAFESLPNIASQRVNNKFK